MHVSTKQTSRNLRRTDGSDAYVGRDGGPEVRKAGLPGKPHRHPGPLKICVQIFAGVGCRCEQKICCRLAADQAVPEGQEPPQPPVLLLRRRQLGRAEGLICLVELDLRKHKEKCEKRARPLAKICSRWGNAHVNQVRPGAGRLDGLLHLRDRQVLKDTTPVPVYGGKEGRQVPVEEELCLLAEVLLQLVCGYKRQTKG